ncbi:hypothetical protein [Pseudonocardia sp. DLS-67]
MTTFTDGNPPSVTPEPDDDGSVPHRAEAPDVDPDTGSAWLHDEIQRRIADGVAAGGGRHARRGEPTSAGSVEYVARHSVATPGPGAPRPGPVGGQMSQASELLRRERTEGTTAQPVWSGPPTRPDENRSEAAPPEAAAAPPGTAPGNAPPGPAPPGPPDRDGGVRPVRPGVAAAAAMRGAARGRARAATGPATAPVAPVQPVAVAPAPQSPADAPPQDPSATAPVETTPADAAPVDTTPGPVAEPAGPMPAPSPAAPDEAVGPSAPTAPRLPATIPDPDVAEHTAPVRAVRKPSGAPERAGSPLGGISVPEQRGAELRGTRSPLPTADQEDPEDPENKRVRVVLAERKGVARPVRTVITIQESSGVGELLRRNLIGSQLAIALRFAIGAGLTLGLLPLLFAIVPEIGRVEVLGIRLPWLLLGVLVYPFLFGLGLWHTRTAEHLEQDFAETVQD